MHGNLFKHNNDNDDVKNNGGEQLNDSNVDGIAVSLFVLSTAMVQPYSVWGLEMTSPPTISGPGTLPRPFQKTRP